MMIRESFNLNYQTTEVKDILYKIAIQKLFSTATVGETEILVREDNVSIKPEYYFPQSGDAIYIYSKLDGASKLVLKT